MTLKSPIIQFMSKVFPWILLAFILRQFNKQFLNSSAGEYQVGCALIIGKRKPSTDLKTRLNDALRDFNVSV